MMNLERRLFLEQNIGERLTQEEWEQGYHFCGDWDFLLVGPEDVEANGCTCIKEDGTELYPNKDTWPADWPVNVLLYDNPFGEGQLK